MKALLVVLGVLSILTAPALSAISSVDVDVERAADKTYVVEAAFDVDVPATVGCGVLTDYEGVRRFDSVIRQEGKHVVHQLKAGPTGRQPAELVNSAIKDSVKRLLDEVRTEMVARSAR